MTKDADELGAPTGDDAQVATGGPATGSTPQSAASGRRPTGEAARPTSLSPVAADGKAPGVTATEIRIGYGTQKDADQAAGGFGLNASFGDQEGQARAIVDDINRRGGVLGRKLVLVFHDDKTANDNANPDATATSQCNDWTQDRPVFAGVNIVGGRNRPSLYACMAKAHTPLLVSDLASHTLAEVSTYAPYLFMPGVATVERYVPTWIERLNARGYFGAWNATTGGPGAGPVRVGVPYVDSNAGRLYLDVVRKALARVGRHVDDSFAFADGTDALTQIPGIVLRFKSNNITHVLLPASAYLVTPVAESQAYRPRYGMTTLDGLASLTVTTSPRAQLRGTLGIGWFPATDTDAAHDPGDVSANETRCKGAMAAAGFATPDRLTLTTQLIVCELFLMLAQSLQQAGGVNAASLQRGAAGLGTSFPSAITFLEHFGVGRYDGAAAARDLKFDDACGCFVYLDGVNRSFPS